MTAGARPLRERLRTIDPAHAMRQTQLIAALNARTIDGITLSARAAFERDRHAAGAWIRFSAGDAETLVAPLLVDGELARLRPGAASRDPATAAALLARIEAVIVALECALGADLYPAGLQIDAPDNAILLRVDASAPPGTIRHRLLVALPRDGAVPPPQLPQTAPALVATLRARWRAVLDGPPLSVSRLGAIGVGDLMLLGIRPLVARTIFNGRSAALTGRVDLIGGTITLQDDIAQQPDATAGAQAAAAGDAIDLEALKVATTIEIEGGQLAASDIAGLAAGSVLPLPTTGGTLTVRVVAGGTPIGQGELVAVGEGFGVLFTSVAGSPAIADEMARD